MKALKLTYLLLFFLGFCFFIQAITGMCGALGLDHIRECDTSGLMPVAYLFFFASLIALRCMFSLAYSE